ncbi:homoserine O-acetyltransferase [Natronospira sp. AB-CW4]|uniref:Serine O-succinyltransferase n=1 Tax=Natronospira bacteriovora TaxID=3069753 RepID=A0ABU0W3W2_9GAMM|nr:homoserine O-acetyltransferase [Natronospira sp. AB-CW4]MDQ2068703.1 homoserine O-acetyltransferase [Natronospira sp. AB-CW4]
MNVPSQPPASRVIELPDPLETWCGDSLPGVRLVCESWGERRGNGDNTILLFTGLSPSAHAASSEQDPSDGWWEAMVGPGKPIDTRRFHVLCFNSLGSCFGSTGPASPRPGGDEPWRLDFPELRVEDIAAATRAALDVMGIRQLHAIVGPSLGGMSALAFLLRYPGSARHLLSISSAERALPFAIAVRSLQREIVRSDPAWQGGHYDSDAQPASGMRLARKLGMISYRSPGEWTERFGRRKMAEPDPGFGPRYEIESYLAAQADRFVGGFDPNCYIYLSRAMDLFDVDDHVRDGQSPLQALAELESAAVVGVESDILFPLQQQRALADNLADVGVATRFHGLASIQGHDAFLVDDERFGPVIADYLAGI